jgi:hypothetical protein
MQCIDELSRWREVLGIHRRSVNDDPTVQRVRRTFEGHSREPLKRIAWVCFGLEFTLSDEVRGLYSDADAFTVPLLLATTTRMSEASRDKLL